MTPAHNCRQGDALLLIQDIADNTDDAIITDPPYSSGGYAALAARRVATAAEHQADVTVPTDLSLFDAEQLNEES